jgi:hypothetical protein
MAAPRSLFIVARFQVLAKVAMRAALARIGGRVVLTVAFATSEHVTLQ